MAIKNQLNELDYLPAINVHLLERRISCVTVPRIVDAIHAACVEDRKITVAHYNVHSFNFSMQLPWFYEFIQSSEIAHCDGMGILKALQFMGYNLSLKYRASYTLLLPKLLENVNQNGLSMFLLGSKPKHLETALTNLRQQYPNLIVNGHHGYFDKEDPSQNQEIINKINHTKPNILLVGMGMPIQEKWIWQHRSRLNVNVFMPCGAVIDRLAGLVPDCPEFISNLGGEWLYRLSREPKRLAARYLLGNPAFFFQLALAKFYAQPLRVEKMGYMLNGQKQSLGEPVSLLSPLPQGIN